MCHFPIRSLASVARYRRVLANFMVNSDWTSTHDMLYNTVLCYMYFTALMPGQRSEEFFVSSCRLLTVGLR